MPERTITENVVFFGSATGTGFVLEMTDERLNGNTGLLTGAVVAGLSATGSFFLRDGLIENTLDGVAAGSMGWLGGKLRQERFLSGAIGGNGNGNTGGATGRLRATPATVNRSRSNNNRNSNVVEM